MPIVLPRWTRRAVAVIVAGTLAAPTFIASPTPAQAATGVGYTYDAAGRLTSVTDTAGTTRSFTYDAVGNLLGVAAGAPPARAQAQLQAAPSAAAPSAVGARFATVAGRPSVMLTGRNLPDADTAHVKIGGLLATVRSAGPGSLVADVPPGLSGGTQRVSVAGEAGTATATTTLPGPVAAVTEPDREPADLQAHAGVTAVSGRVRDSATGLGLAGVELAVDAVTTRSGPDGRFLLAGIEPGHHEMEIDASTIESGDHGIYEVGVDAAAGRTTQMAWTTWLTKIDTASAVALPATITHEIVVTSPTMPGLEVHVPPGTRLTDDGKPVTSLSMTKMPLDRQVFPGAPGMTLAWTLQPGGATVSGPGLRVVYPNLAHQAPGVGIDFVDHDADRPGLGWKVYGHGNVTPDGTQITPDATTRLHKTYQLGVSYSPLCQYLGLFCPRAGDKGTDGDPVDLQTGLFVFSHTDLVMPDVLPVALTRTYRQNDYVVRSFGVGQNDAFNAFVSPDGAGNYVVQMPDGSSVPFAPTADPTVYKPVPTPTELAGSTMTTDNHRNFTVAMTDGRTWTFGGETASLISTADHYGNVTTLTRDINGRLTRATSPNGRWIALTWGDCATSVQCIVSAQDNLGRTVGYRYDASGRMVGVTDVAGKATTYTWAPCNDSIICTELASITDPLGVAFVRNTFDTTGRVTTQKQPDGTAYTFSYTKNANDQVTATTVTDPRGDKRRMTFDASGYSASDTAGYTSTLAATTTLTRDAAHRVTNTVDPLARRTTLTYDATGAVLTRTRLAGTAGAVTDTLTYEPAYHRLASVTNPLGKKGTLAYDDDNQTVTVTDALGHSAVTTLSDGQPVTITDPLGHTTHMSYLDGDPVTVVDPLGRAHKSYYDGAGRLLKSTDPLGNRVSYSYAVTNQPVGVTDPLGHTSSATYDADGRLVSLTDALAHTRSYSYDALGRLTSSTDALGKVSTYSYDANGNLTGSVDRAGIADVYTYDPLDRLATAGFGLTGSSTYQSTVTDTYDAANRLTKAVDTTGGTLTDTYDGLDRITGESTAQGSVTYTFDAAGRRTGMTVAGQPATTYTYDAGNRLTAVSNNLGTVGLTYDADDKQIAIQLPGGTSEAFTLDAAGQTSAIAYTAGATSLGSLSYTYDAAGRRTGVGGPLARTALPPVTSGGSTYNADNALTARGTSSFSYDAQGQLASDGARQYSWNARHQLTGITGGTPASSYTYDPLGRRLTRTVGTTTTGFVYDGPNVVQEKTGTTVSANLLTGFGADQTFARSDAAGNRSLLTDALGSTIALTGSTGAVATSYTYDPYRVASTTGAANSNPLQFTGRENDGTGLDYYRARYYSPAMQRFISQDPAGPAGSGANLYAYAGDAPTNYTDPSGKQLLPGCLIGAAIGLGGGLVGSALNGTKYTFGEGLRDAAVGCAFGLVGAWFGEVSAAGAPEVGAGVEGAEDALQAGVRGAVQDGATDVGEDAAESCLNSFTGDTPVTMANGTTKPIKEVAVGDTVLATDPETSVSRSEPVIGLIRHTGRHTMVAIMLADGSVLDSTDGHPIWDDTTRAFTAAGHLKVGDKIETSTGQPLAIAGLMRYSSDLTAYNLQISQIHTYYAGATPVLVHNSCTPNPFRGTNMSDEDSLAYHFEKHGDGRTLEQYAQDAQSFAENPAGRTTSVELRDGTTGTSYRTPGGPGGILDANGNVVTFWYQ